MLNHAFNLKRQLDKVENCAVNMLILGDLNTMGLKYPRQWKAEQIVQTVNELDYIDYQCKAKGKGRYKDCIPNMRRLSKPAGTFYSKRYGISDLDHIIAADQLRFIPQSMSDCTEAYEVLLDGWNRFGSDEERERFADEVSSTKLRLQ